MTKLHDMHITDPDDPTRQAEVNSIKEVRTFNPTSVTIQSAALTTMTDKSQITNIAGSVSSGNSTTTPLPGDTGGSDHIFEGASLDILNCGIVFVNVYADVASATDGLSIQQSSDGTNWDHDDNYTIAAGATKNFSINPHAQYFRVVYTNGAGAQSAFRLQTICKSQNAKPSSHRVKDEIIGDDDVTLVKAALTGENGDGLWHNVKTDADGNLYITNRSSGLDIALGNVTGTSNTNKFGNAPDFDTGDGEVDITDLADDSQPWQQMTYTFSSSADIDRISSSDNGDTVDIEIQGLDTNWDLVTQTITLTGQTAVALSTSLIRIFRMKNVGATDLAGTVFCFVNVATTGGVPNTPANIRAAIDNGNNQTEMAIYAIPRLTRGAIGEIYASTAGGSRSTNYIIKLYIRPFGGVFQLKHRRAINDDKDLEKVFSAPEIAQAKSDIKMTVETESTAITGSSVSAGFDIVLVDD